MRDVIVIMGVSGSGKTTVGAALAAATGGAFFDGDDFHSEGNVRKMRSGTPLTDEDRQEWLESLRDLIARRALERGPTFVACSALKESHRAVLRSRHPGLRFVHLHGPQEMIRSRIDARRGHYMPAVLLASQFAALEPPVDAIAIDISREGCDPVGEILAALKFERGSD